MEELVLLIAFIGAFVSTIAGFGSATILIPFISLIIDIKSAIVLTAIFHLANNLSKLGLMRKSVNSHLFIVYGLPSVVTALFGAWIFGRADTAIIGIILPFS
ncbi:MAG: TSUP family transporter [Archaeoglobaceae archaeon]